MIDQALGPLDAMHRHVSLLTPLQHYIDQGDVVARLAKANEQITDLRAANRHHCQQKC